MTDYILGISALYHDSAAVLLADGVIVAAAQEERFSRKRHDAAFPDLAIRYCLAEAGIGLARVSAIVFYDKPLLKFERLLETHLATAPTGLPAFIKAMPVWLKEKLFLKKLLRDRLKAIAGNDATALPPLYFSSHHQAHAASAFYPSPFEQAAVLCLDGVGEWATTSAWLGEGERLTPLWQLDFPHSIGLLYSAFTGYTGFRVNSGEYKLMGLAPYGEPRYVDTILEHLIDLKDDGSFRLDMRYFNYAAGLSMTSPAFHRLFGGPPRTPESEIRQRDMDLAASIQQVTEEIILRLARTLSAETGQSKLCLAGGVALNCVANGRLLRENLFDDIWVQPAADDAGGALGAALLRWHQTHPRQPQTPDAMQGALLGSHYDDAAIAALLRQTGAVAHACDSDALIEQCSRQLTEGKVLGWFQGRMEFGPRALGSRSILGDPRDRGMQATINLKIKYRESFRPFAPAILEAHTHEWFAFDRASPYMLFVSHVREDKRLKADANASGLARLHQPRSPAPAVTHVDYSARLQTVGAQANPRFRRLLQAFHARTGCPILVNTSFNVRGEPIVESPLDALRCFMKTDMDVLALGNHLLLKHQQDAALAERVEQLWTRRQQQRLQGRHADEIDARPQPGQLRRFALVTGAAVALLFGLLFPWLAGKAPNTAWLIGAGAWTLWGGLWPHSLRLPWRLWMQLGRQLGKITSPVMLSILYFGLFTPLGLLLRLLRKDPLKRKLDPKARSYRIPSPPLPDDHLEKPF